VIARHQPEGEDGGTDVGVSPRVAAAEPKRR
jgi:hypothetical protein